MIVLDASAAAELVLETATGRVVGDRLRGESIHAPAHLDVEAVGVIRRAVQRGLLSERDGLIAVGDFIELPIQRWLAEPFITRSYDLRATHSLANALYITLAEGLSAPLLTCDARLARSHGHGATIELAR